MSLHADMFTQLILEAFSLLTLRGSVTIPVFVIVVTPATVLSVIPVPAAKLGLMFATIPVDVISKSGVPVFVPV